jgi:hypothetical protein
MNNKIMLIPIFYLSLVGFTSANTVDEYNILQNQQALTKLAVDINKLKLENIKLENEIAKLTGKSGVNHNLNIKVISTSIFDTQQSAMINVKGKIKEYKLNDNINKDFVIQNITDDGVSVFNSSTDQTKEFVVGV